jgi:glycosyltransferase involved in cell wall biosynthesis
MVSIILSTYNGQNFIETQLNSLLNQNLDGFDILIRDDGSTDKTIEIIQLFSLKHPNRIKIIPNLNGNIGVFESFKNLIENSNSEYYLFCDQDDIWDSDKVPYLLDEIKKIEKIQEDSLPIMVCCDYRIIDENNSVFVKSTHHLYRLKQKEISNGIFKGFIPGCTMIFNNAAKQEFLKYFNLGLHDMHLYIICFLFGNLSLLATPLMSYRIHSLNTLGLRKKTRKIILIKDFLKYIINTKNYRNIILKEYYEMQKTLSSQVSRELLFEKEFYSESYIDNLGILKRKKWYLKHFKPYHVSKLEGVIQTILI